MLKAYIPNLFPLINLSLGIFSIARAFSQDYVWASIVIIIAAFIDRYTGKIFKFSDRPSNLQKELVSLAGLISFGVAPAILIFIKYYFFNLGFTKITGVCLLLLYSIGSCYKLAKCNLKEYNETSIGFSITISGAVIALFALVIPDNSASTILSGVLMVFFTYLILSGFRVKKD